MNNIPSGYKLILTSDEISRAVDYCAEKLNNKYSLLDNIIILSILKGAIYFHVDLARKLKFPFAEKFVEISFYKNDNVINFADPCPNNIDNIDNILKDLCDKHVIVLDELYDTGKTLNTIYSAVMKHRPASIFTCCAFKKINFCGEQNHNPYEPDLFGCYLPNVFLVGYGLDDKQTNRALTNLYALNKVCKVGQDNKVCKVGQDNKVCKVDQDDKVCQIVKFDNSDQFNKTVKTDNMPKKVPDDIIFEIEDIYETYRKKIIYGLPGEDKITYDLSSIV